jgi:hypothetical protein
MFVDFDNRDLRLREGSPAIDEGINLGHSIHFENRPVPLGFAPDLGAYETRISRKSDISTQELGVN